MPGDRRRSARARSAFQVPRSAADVSARSIRGDAGLFRFEREAETGELSLLVTDMKSGTAVTVEYRLQIAFYQCILATLLEGAGLGHVRSATAILNRGTTNADAADPRVQVDRVGALRLFGAGDAYLEVIADPDAYLATVDSLVTRAKSDVLRVAT